MYQVDSSCGNYRKIGSHLYRKEGGAFVHCYISVGEKTIEAMIRQYERSE